MRLKFFRVPTFDSGESEAEVNSFLANHRVATIEKQFVADARDPHWSLCITYSEDKSKPAPEPAPSKSRVDYKEILSPEEFEVFARLRRLRKDAAEREGVPLYAVFTNEQLARMVQKKVGTLQELGELDGVGPARVKKYGTDFLETLTAPSETGEKE